MKHPTLRKRISRLSQTALAVILLPVALGGCEGIFEVDNPSAIAASDLENPELLGPLLNLPEAAGVEDHDNWVQVVGAIGNDVMEPLGTNTWLWQDRGQIHIQINQVLENLFDDLVTANWIIRDARNRIEAVVPNPDSHWAIARSHFWDGHTMLSLADAFEGIPFNGGPPHTPVEVYQMALDAFQRAATVAAAAGPDELQYVAGSYGAMARASRSLFFETGDAEHLANAAQYAQQALAVDPEFRLDARFLPPGSQNGLFAGLGPHQGFQSVGIHEIFGDGWNDPVTGQLDPRINVVGPVGEGPNGTGYMQAKYTSADSPIPVIRWQEAVLIIAEHDLETGDLLGAVEGINQVRAAADLPPFESSDPDEIRMQILYERQTEFFLEGRSWQDLRNYGIFPIRWYPDARELGLNRRIPMSLREKNSNPNL